MITPHIQRMKPLAHLPNQAGFKFVGITHDHQRVDCEVERGGDGLHKVKFLGFGDFKYSDLCGWVNVCH